MEKQLPVRESGMRREPSLKLTVILILLAAAVCACGICCGEMSVVLNKAIHICMECIGIG